LPQYGGETTDPNETRDMKPSELIAALKAKKLRVRRRYVADIDNVSMEHKDVDTDELCALLVTDGTGGPQAVVTWLDDSYVASVFVVSSSKALERKVTDAYLAARSG